MVQDYHYLNKYMVKNNYPLLLIIQLFDKLQGTKIFTKMDFNGAITTFASKKMMNRRLLSYVTAVPLNAWSCFLNYAILLQSSRQ